MVKELPKFKGYTVDERLQEFRKIRVASYRNGRYEDRYIETVSFDSPKGQALLMQMHEQATEIATR